MRVIGFDLSVTRSAACTIPCDWTPGDWGALRWASWPTKPVDLPEDAHIMDKEVARWRRLFGIADAITEYVADEMRAEQAAYDEKPEQSQPQGVRVFCEDYTYGTHNPGTRLVAELRGVLAVRLAGIGHMLIPMNVTRARTFLFGSIRRPKKGEPKLPKGAVKKFIQQGFESMKAPFGNDDERDSFAVANLGLTELGITALTLASKAA